MLQALRSQPANNSLSQIKQMMNLVKSAQNPQAMLNQMVQNNPGMRQVMNLINQSGGDPRTAFYQMAEAQGIDPEQILAMLR